MIKEHQIEAILWGCGMMGQIVVRYLHEKGIKLVGVIDRNESRVGKDVGEVCAIGQNLGVSVRPPEEAEQVFEETQANVCIICTRSTIADLYDLFEMAARHGVNAITIGEEAFYPHTTSPDRIQKLDRLATENNCTLTGSGFQDVFCGHLVATIAGAAHRIDRIEVMTRYNLDDYGRSLAEHHGAGMTVEAFEQTVATQDTPPFNWHVNEWLCARFGWTIRTQKTAFVPTIETETVRSTCLELDIPTGSVTGMRAIVTTETQEGPVVETQIVGKVYAPGEEDLHECTIAGEPTISLTLRQPATPELTCATAVNRLPQLIAAPAGFQTTDRMPPPDYSPVAFDRTRPLRV